jgi:glycerol-3-phosphate dehydrogenase
MQPVLILGAGINGAALARELVVNGVPVCVVDTADIASGTTAYSSRLIHGGLRYLEHGEFDLVRESLAERTRLLRLAPQYVHPLELFIPVSRRASGLWSATRRMLGRPERAAGEMGESPSRGLWLVRLGLWLYDLYARDPVLPKHRAHRVDDPRLPPVDRARYGWQCSYFDAAVQFPERFVLALLEDARQEAARQGIDFRVLNYHEARLTGKTAEVSPVGQVSNVPGRQDACPTTFQPAAIINATGAWVDETLKRLNVPSRRLIGGTKGSHFLTSHAGLRAALAGRGIYAEAADGRPVFLLPLAESSLVGTTDIPFTGDPAAAVATDEELEYLVDAANRVFPQLRLGRADIDWHYSGVRPLPFCDAATPAAITRRHWLEENTQCPVPLYSVIGGKLTTCRSLAEEATDVILRRLGLPRRPGTRQRVIPGGEDYPRDLAALQGEQSRLADKFGLPEDAVRAIWQLYGTRTEAVVRECGNLRETLKGTFWPVSLVRHSIRHEWARRIDDLVCRRLMLLYEPQLRRNTLRHLAELLAAEGRLADNDTGLAVEQMEKKLLARYGKRVE